MSPDGLVDLSRTLTNEVPAPLIPRGHQPAQPVVQDVDLDKWRAFGAAVLGFHARVECTGMCRCGRTWLECDVWRQAEQYGIRQLPQ